ncbi:hypothetical protein [Paenibacillus pinihumi]|uniref:hypothetical protein n=1 Tax=Paenibacillus pinihumi TaxID=669462 RepID=UPI0004904485|nr:hypothetical protein [Paenibacillus pinihumi]
MISEQVERAKKIFNPSIHDPFRTFNMNLQNSQNAIARIYNKDLQETISQLKRFNQTNSEAMKQMQKLASFQLAPEYQSFLNLLSSNPAILNTPLAKPDEALRKIETVVSDLGALNPSEELSDLASVEPDTSGEEKKVLDWKWYVATILAIITMYQNYLLITKDDTPSTVVNQKIEVNITQVINYFIENVQDDNTE